MEAQFVNTYIQKQNQLIQELMNKNLMVETKLELLETKHSELVAAHTSLVESLEKAKNDFETAQFDQPLDDYSEDETTESQF